MSLHSVCSCISIIRLSKPEIKSSKKRKEDYRKEKELRSKKKRTLPSLNCLQTLSDSLSPDIPQSDPPPNPLIIAVKTLRAHFDTTTNPRRSSLCLSIITFSTSFNALAVQPPSLPLNSSPFNHHHYRSTARRSFLSNTPSIAVHSAVQPPTTPRSTYIREQHTSFLFSAEQLCRNRIASIVSASSSLSISPPSFSHQPFAHIHRDRTTEHLSTPPMFGKLRFHYVCVI
ncbi:unnamed protein product [Vicia faba]|uniref:Uncharacterized protein n=1 Tax=Vicia faba TaxID=3906 RepID=A0AAV1AND7_VICFA|nr:unnamed protein product [Vicia faba]